MAEQLKRLSRPDHEEAQRLIGLLTDGSSTVSKVNKGEYLETLTAYQQRVVAQLDAPNPEQAERIEKISAEIQALREAAEQSVPKADLEKVTAQLSRVQKEAEETSVRQREEMERLAEDLRVAQSDENPRVVELKKQVAELERTQEETGLRHQEAIRSLEEQVVELQRVIKEDHPREIEEITRRADGEAENVRLLQLQMKGNQAAAMEVARLPHDQAAAKLEEAQLAHDAIEEDTPENNVQKAVLTYKMDLLEAKQAEHLAIQEAFVAERRAGAEEALGSPDVAVVGEIIKALNELYRTTEEALVAACEEHRVLDQVADAELRNEPVMELALNKVRSLESQVASLRTSIETYQKSGANQILPDVRLLQELISLVPEASRGEVVPYLMHAVQAIVHMQQRLAPEFGAESVHHSRIEGLLQQIYTWNGEYLDITDSSVAALRGGARDVLSRSLRYELPTILQAIVGYMQMAAANIGGEITTKRYRIEELKIEHTELNRAVDKDERAIRANRAQFAIQNIYLNTLYAIQVVHQPLHQAHVELEWQKTVLGTMQRLIVGFFSMISSIPGMMIGGLQTMGHPLVGKK